MDAIRKFFSTGDYMPHAHCFLWPDERGLLFLHLISDLLIGLSYVAISLTLAYLVWRGRDVIAFHRMFLAFGIFIIACGATHFMEIWTLFNAHYWVSGGVKAVTAAASLFTAIALPPLLPVALTMVKESRLAELRRIEAETSRRQVEQLYEKLREFDLVKTEFFANVSHELRTPLALILGPAERLLSRPAIPDAEREDLLLIQRNATTLLKHVNDLLDVARMESGKAQLHYGRVDCAGALRLIAANFSALAGQKQIRFDIEAPEELPMEADIDKLNRILINLTSNAFKFTPDGGVVQLVVREKGDMVEFQVRDSGPGVPADKRELIFERFRQLEGGTTRRFGGTGLGLAIARDFAQLHGGAIEVSDAPEGGASFTVTLPRRAPEGVKVEEDQHEAAASEIASQAALNELAAVAGPAAAAGGARQQVLVVEDNREMNRFVSQALGSDFDVHSAFDGEEGLQAAKDLLPDVIVSDLMMPKVSGDELLRALREDPATGAIPVILLTARAEDETRLVLLAGGAQDFVTKPFGIEELRLRVRNQASLKRVRDLLAAEVEEGISSIGDLAREVASQKRALASSLDAARAALERANAAATARQQFLRLASHELRTPLATLQLQLDVFKRTGQEHLNERHRRALQRIESSTSRLNQLVESVLQYARVESGRFEVHREWLSLPPFIEEIAAEFRTQQASDRLELTHQCDLPPGGALYTDPRLLRLVLVNLVDNAMKFTKDGVVSLSVRNDEDGGVIFAVADTGPGIERAAVEHLFDPFTHQADVSEKSTPGLGLGLAIVRELVDVLGGAISVRPAQPRGSVFEVRIAAGAGAASGSGGEAGALPDA